jgi:hypothetical protein
LRIVNSRALSREGVIAPESVVSLGGWNPGEWAARVLEARSAERKDRRAEIAAAGFDINHNAGWLENFYLEAVSAGAADRH